MKITRISRLQNHGVYRDFTWPPVLPDFRQYNLIYGWNGTGKTTLSRLFRDLEFRRPPTLGKVKLRIDDNDYKGQEFPGISKSSFQVRVFNKDFIQENVFPLEKRDIPPILVLGAGSVTKQKEVEKLKKQLVEAEKELESAKSTENTTKDELDNFCRDRARVIKETLRVSGPSQYNNYDKSNFRTHAMNMIGAEDKTKYELTETVRENLLSQHRETLKPKVDKVVYDFPNFSGIMENLSELLTATVVSEVIEALKVDTQLANWTQQGLVLHRDRNSELCQFCEQPLPRDRIATLERHFSDQYEKFMQRIVQEINKLNSMSQKAANIILPDKARLYSNLTSEYETQKANLKSALRLAQDFIDIVVQELEIKKNKAFEQVSFNLQAPEVSADIVEELNRVIERHNQDCNSFESQVKDARERLAKDMIAGYSEDFARYIKKEQDIITDKKKKDQEVNRLSAEIERLEAEIVEHRQPAEELNKDLQNYLGHNELFLEVKKTGYAMTRDGVPAQYLSEGEITAIALLYFLKSLEDKEFEREKGVIVLDDPVSSLDANALFLAFGFIRERTDNACQLFILTHNFSLFQQVCNWFHHMRGQNRRDENQHPARFYMLDSVLESGGKNSTIRRLDPLLEEYDSEYHYLFVRVYNASNEGSSSSLEQNYVLPNMARRMLEAFLAFRVPEIMGNLRKQLDRIQFDETKKLRIYRFLHTYSHSAAVGEPEHDLSVLNEGPSVLKDLMDMMKSEDRKHFLAMEGLVTRSREQGITE